MVLSDMPFGWHDTCRLFEWGDVYVVTPQMSFLYRLSLEVFFPLPLCRFSSVLFAYSLKKKPHQETPK